MYVCMYIVPESWLVYPWYLSNKCNQEETIKQFKGNQTVYYVWERRMLFVLSVCTSQNCTCKSSYILNGNSLKLCMLSFYHMKNCISLQHFDWIHVFFEGVIAIWPRIFPYHHMEICILFCKYLFKNLQNVGWNI